MRYPGTLQTKTGIDVVPIPDCRSVETGTVRPTIGKADDFYGAGIVAVEACPEMIAISRSWALFGHTPPQLCLRHFSPRSSSLWRALTVVLAVGAVRGWRGAIGGAALAVFVLLLLVVVLGPAITQIPEADVQLV
jgi:hypothetical protein